MTKDMPYMKNLILILPLFMASPSLAQEAQKISPIPKIERPSEWAPAKKSQSGTSATPAVSPQGNPHKAYFDKLDSNKDGLITDYEFIAAQKNLLKLRDLNKDGKVTRQENISGLFQEHTAKFYGPHIVTPALSEKFNMQFDREDVDKDGFITEYENMTNYRSLFKQADENGDNTVTWKEYQLFIDKMIRQKKPGQ